MPGWIKALAAVVVLVAAAFLVGPRVWNEVREYQETLQAAEDSAPVGYLGLNYRRSYHDKPLRFLYEESGRKKLWAARGEDGQPEFYDVTEAGIAVEKLSGGYGRDSVPGVDYPIFEGPESERFARLRARQEFYGLESPDGPRGYPAELLKKIEVVNDRDPEGPFAIVFDRSRDEARFYGRALGGVEITFGTTGYAYGPTEAPDTGQPLLYDRPTRSLWLPEGDALVCVSGESRGARLPEVRTPERTTWGDWVSKHPATRVLMGNDREKPIPEH